ncbi:MAG: hypothetical protein ACK4TK_11870, partial [Thiobacillaceae bacterium]
MVRLPLSISAWGTPAFEPTLRSELKALPPESLPLDALTSQGGRVEGVTLCLLAAESSDRDIRARLGVLFTEWVGGCSCGDGLMSVEGYG